MFIIIILILINFTSITLSDSKGGSCSSNSANSSNSNNIFGNIFSTNQKQNQYPIQHQNQNYYIPSPVQSNAPSALNKKINLNNQTYDYSKYFFI